MKSYLEKQSPLFYLLPKFQKAYQGSNPSPSPRYASGRYYKQRRGLRLQHHQCEAFDDQSKSTKWTNPRGNPPSIPGYLNKKLKITRDIQAE
jgi:hypothetical protein